VDVYRGTAQPLSPRSPGHEYVPLPRFVLSIRAAERPGEVAVLDTNVRRRGGHFTGAGSPGSTNPETLHYKSTEARGKIVTDGGSHKRGQPLVEGFGNCAQSSILFNENQ
jgi:hypothetical protein